LTAVAARPDNASRASGTASRPRPQPDRGPTPGGGQKTPGGQDTAITELDRHWYLDLHSHSTDASDDAGGTVEGYLKWIVARRKRGYQIDGFVLTEHRHYDPHARYDELAERYGVTVLRGAELETDIGHVLVYGVTPALARHFDFSSVTLPHRSLFRAARDEGGFAVGAHAGRPRIGLAHYVEHEGLEPDGIHAVEQLNGGSSDEENGRALELAQRFGLRCVGGSDAHYVSAIGRCLTAFSRPVRTIEELVHELAHGEYHAVTVEQTVAAGAAGPAAVRQEGTS
jgi:predicted metal-dependent phosphoesterase TrpH